nr:acylglycerol kinase family protein [Clostridia bacterium]
MYGVLINPTAGTGYARRVGTLVEEALRVRGITFETFMTAYPGHAEALARQAADRGVKTLFVVGGDGTIFEAARGLSRTEGVLAIIPAGTGND